MSSLKLRRMVFGHVCSEKRNDHDGLSWMALWVLSVKKVAIVVCVGLDAVAVVVP